MLLVNSTPLSEYLHDRYLEDFQYVDTLFPPSTIFSSFLSLACRFFLKEDVILSRIPVQYPVYRFIPDLIRSVHHRIVYSEPDLSPSNRPKHRQLI